jgi:tetratricopeptide (TPR) repeat protein
LEGRYEEAEKAGRKAVVVLEGLARDHPKTPSFADDLASTRCGLAYTLADQPGASAGARAEAIRLANKAVEHGPEVPSFRGTLATVLYRAGDWRGAILAKEKTIELAKTADAQDWLILAMSRWQLGDTKRARADFDRALEWMRQNPTKDKDDELGRLRAEAAALLGVTDNPRSTGKKEDRNPRPSKP